MAFTFGVGLGDFGPAMLLDAERARLFAQVGVLAARHAVHIHLRGARADIALEGDVAAADLLPVRGDPPEIVRIEPRVARTVAQRLDDRSQIRLRCEAREGIDCAVDGIRARLDRGEDARRPDAAGVVGVEMNRQPELLLQRLDERRGRAGLAEPPHVLDAKHVRAHGFQFAGDLEVVLEAVLGLARIGEIAGVADGGLAQPVRRAAPLRWSPSCSRPSSGSRIPGTRRCRPRPPAAMK